MKVRAVTIGAPLASPLRPETVHTAGRVAAAICRALVAAGIEVQTRRLATPPLVKLLGAAEQRSGSALQARALHLAQALDTLAAEAGFGYASLGALDATPATEETVWMDLLDLVPQIIRSTERVFCAVSIASHAAGINLAAARMCGEVVSTVASQSPDGFGNLRFAALANCPPHIPFFPAAYHDGRPRLTAGIALEAADLAVRVFAQAPSLDDAARDLRHVLAERIRSVSGIVTRALAGTDGVTFSGVDLSLAPYPAEDRSIAYAFERLGVPAFGSHGTLFIAAFLTDCLEQVWRETRELYDPSTINGTQRFGFSGLMLPVLEDAVLAQRAAEGTFGVDSLLLYSTVCGLGLDTVPLPGDTPSGEVGAIMLDMATLAVRLDKPLTARLFPVPGKRAGDPVAWDFAYFAPSRVLPVRGLSPSGALLAANTYNPVQ